MKLFVRPATNSDAAAFMRMTSDVQLLHNQALPELFRMPDDGLFDTEKLAALLEDSNVVVAVAELGGEIVGHVYAELDHRAENAFRYAETSIYIHQIGVDEVVRGQGVGTALMSFIEERAAELGASAIGLDHWAFNARAKSFFEARGFASSQVKMRKKLKA